MKWIRSHVAAAEVAAAKDSPADAGVFVFGRGDAFTFSPQCAAEAKATMGSVQSQAGTLRFSPQCVRCAMEDALRRSLQKPRVVFIVIEAAAAVGSEGLLGGDTGGGLQKTWSPETQALIVPPPVLGPVGEATGAGGERSSCTAPRHAGLADCTLLKSNRYSVLASDELEIRVEDDDARSLVSDVGSGSESGSASGDAFDIEVRAAKAAAKVAKPTDGGGEVASRGQVAGRADGAALFLCAGVGARGGAALLGTATHTRTRGRRRCSRRASAAPDTAAKPSSHVDVPATCQIGTRGGDDGAAAQADCHVAPGDAAAVESVSAREVGVTLDPFCPQGGVQVASEVRLKILCDQAAGKSEDGSSERKAADGRMRAEARSNVTPSGLGLALSGAMKDSLIEYHDMGSRLMGLLARQHELGKEVTEEHLAYLCFEQIEEEIHTEEELFDLQRLVEVVINRLEMKDGAIVEIRPSEVPERSELRVLALRPDLCAA